MTSWDNQETEAVVAWLESGENKSQVEEVVRTWNDLELLGIDLADQIQKLVTNTAPRLAHRSVDWDAIAEHLAEEIVSVDEDELTRRRIELGGEE